MEHQPGGERKQLYTNSCLKSSAYTMISTHSAMGAGIGGGVTATVEVGQSWCEEEEPMRVMHIKQNLT